MLISLANIKSELNKRDRALLDLALIVLLDILKQFLKLFNKQEVVKLPLY